MCQTIRGVYNIPELYKDGKNAEAIGTYLGMKRHRNLKGRVLIK